MLNFSPSLHTNSTFLVFSPSSHLNLSSICPRILAHLILISILCSLIYCAAISYSLSHFLLSTALLIARILSSFWSPSSSLSIFLSPCAFPHPLFSLFPISMNTPSLSLMLPFPGIPCLSDSLVLLPLSSLFFAILSRSLFLPLPSCLQIPLHPYRNLSIPLSIIAILDLYLASLSEIFFMYL